MCTRVMNIRAAIVHMGGQIIDRDRTRPNRSLRQIHIQPRLLRYVLADHTGRVAYKAGWTIAPEIREALDDTVRVRQLKREASEKGQNFRTYYKNSLSYLRNIRSS